MVWKISRNSLEKPVHFAAEHIGQDIFVNWPGHGNIKNFEFSFFKKITQMDQSMDSELRQLLLQTGESSRLRVSDTAF